MKLRIWALLLFTWAASAWSQTSHPKEVIHLKNGSVLRGTITEWVPEVSLTIQLADNSVFVCPIGDVAKVTREFAQSPSEEPKVLRAAPVLFNPRIGLEFNAGASRLSFDMGYQTQQMPFLILNASDPWNPYFDKIYRFSEALCFNVGLLF